MAELALTFFGDFASPESYLAEVGLWRCVAEDGVSVRCRAMEEEAPSDQELARRLSTLAPLAAELQLALRAPAHHPSTAKAHEAARFAREHGREPELRQAIHRAHWAEGHDIGRIDVLVELAGAVGLDPLDARIALDIDRFRDEVAHDRALARKLRLTRAPVLYLGTGADARILVGPWSPDDLARALADG